MGEGVLLDQEDPRSQSIGLARALTSLKWLRVIRKFMLWSSGRRKESWLGRGNMEPAGENGLRLEKRVFNNKPLTMKNFRDKAEKILMETVGGL